jgi:serine/threonine-protein kinase HipA
MEKLIPVIDEFCSFPAIEKADFFKRVLFCYVTGNEDMHLKNFSLITKSGKTTLTPAHDFLNSTIAIKNAEGEIALTLAGKKNNLKTSDFIEYYTKDRLQLNDKTVAIILGQMQQVIPKWKELLEISFLSEDMKEKYLDLMETKTQMFK